MKCAITGRPMNWSYSEEHRAGDRTWWISDVRKIQSDYPDWGYRFYLDRLSVGIHTALAECAKVH